MKKYIIPQTECIEAIFGSVICGSLDGGGQQTDPDPSGPPGGAPWRF